MEPGLCRKWQEVEDGSACVRGGQCRYAHNQDELVQITNSENAGKVKFLTDVRSARVQPF